MLGARASISRAGGGRMAQLIGAYLGAAARACVPVPRVIRIAAAGVREEEKDRRQADRREICGKLSTDRAAVATVRPTFDCTTRRLAVTTGDGRKLTGKWKTRKRKEKEKRIASEEVTFALIKSKCLPVLLYGTEAYPINSAMKHSLQFALNRALFKIFGSLSKDTYKDIYKYFGMGPMDEEISARQSKFYLRYCATKSAVCHSISKLR